MVLPQKIGVTALSRRTRQKKKSFRRCTIIISILLITILYTYIPSRKWLFKSFLKRGDISHGDGHNISNTITIDKNISSLTKDDDIGSSKEKIVTIVDKNVSSLTKDDDISISERKSVTAIPIEEKCTFRKYEPPRHYGLNSEDQPTFLSQAKYIRGMLPFIINPGREGLKKICMDTNEWEIMDSENGQRWPFSDGQNPSFISLRNDPYGLSGGNNRNQLSQRIDRDTITVLAEIYGADKLQDMFMGLLLFGDSQCRWNMTPSDLRQQGFSPLNKAPGLRSVVVIMDRNRNPVGNATLKLVQDTTWGTGRRKVPRKMKSPLQSDTNCLLEGGKIDACFERSIVQLDDSRFFFHAGVLHVLFRNGPFFGYETQVQHPVHIEAIGDGKFEAYIKASEMFEIRGGRNIAFISDIPRSPNDFNNQSQEGNASHNNSDNELLALTWVDPVTVEVVHTPNSVTSSTATVAIQENIKRRLRNRKKNKSHIHGTNGYLLPLHSTSELLGVAHFHRPEDRKKNTYARFGHHYTHAFFTLQKKEGGEENSSHSGSSFFLKRLSNEFIFESPTSDASDGDIIQFASGLDLVGSDTEGKLLISYGINDCESASFFLNMDYVQGLLQDVKFGDEVINLMAEIGKEL